VKRKYIDNVDRGLTHLIWFCYAGLIACAVFVVVAWWLA